MSAPRDNAPAQQEQHYHEAIGNAQLKLSLRSIPELERASARAELAAVSLLDAADLDARPTFAIDNSSDVPHEGPLDFIYVNPALAASPSLLAKMQGNDSLGAFMFTDTHEPHTALKSWLWGKVEETDPAIRGRAYSYGGHLWWLTNLGHYAIVSGIPSRLIWPDGGSTPRCKSVDPGEHQQPRYMPQYIPGHVLSVPKEQDVAIKGPFDYTLDPPPTVMSDHIRYFRSVEWEKTPLGPMDSWCPQLRCVVNMMMNDSYPAVIFWGDQATMIYNEAYIELISLMHPCIGQSAQIAAEGFWTHFQPLVDYVNATGETVSNHELPLFLDRHGFLEETYFSFQFTPVLNGDGHIAGYYQSLVETTKNGLLERRVSSLVEIGSQTAKARNLQTYWDLVLNTIAINDKDVPFALLYAADGTSTPNSTSLSSPGTMSAVVEQFTLKGAIGVEAGHASAPSTVDIRIDTSTVFHSSFMEAMNLRKPIVIHFNELGLPDGMLDGIDWKGYGDPCRSVVICPILPTTSEQVQGFLILGINPRRPFDDDYQQFVHVMLRLLATSHASVVLFEEEIQQREKAIGQAARIQEQLLAELQLKEKKFQRFAERSDVGIFTMDAVGNFTYRNQSWYALFECAADQENVMGALNNVIFPDDAAKCEGIFATLVMEKAPVCFELRTKMAWSPPTESGAPEPKQPEHYKWILCSAYADMDAKGDVIEIVGNVTDISKQKWAEGVQKIRTDDALEGKRHLEHFVDTTSHEMRNPLSAIMQCADGIITSFPSADSDLPVPSPTSYTTLLEQTLDAAQTIVQCAQHMKRIVDDILTISKLDSSLLVITPIDAQPESVTSHAIKMFESEAKAADINMKLRVDQSFRDLQVDWVSLDPTRLLQVLINLITNALKFTRLEDTRDITVTLAASEQKPTSVTEGFQFEEKLVDDYAHLVDDWKRGSVVYLQFSVIDTGRGLSETERSSLFARFSQASPRTHINYGGSGLGLFISRRLTEMQGGAIGLSSEFEKGSTFSFYIKARRTSATRPRRPSLHNLTPEDVRHRATTHKEIYRMRKPSRSPALEAFNSTIPQISQALPDQPQDESRTSEANTSSADKLNKPRRPSTIRRQSALNSDVPAEAIGLPPDPDLHELQRTKSYSETMHVLVVEDNLVNQKVLAQQLRKLGCVVSVANHGVEALDFLQRTKYWSNNNNPPHDISLIDPPTFSSTPSSSPQGTSPNDADLPIDLSVILMDWEMPIMNGLTATRKIREAEKEGRLIGRVPVIGVTANVRQEQIQEAMDAGMDDVVSKPFRVAELMGRMRGIVKGVGGGGDGDRKGGEEGGGCGEGGVNVNGNVNEDKVVVRGERGESGGYFVEVV
ncbi:hypothetical protein CC80DRAFT_482446 [Byssothecium circinans]|uniref:Histidine kinase HHK11p n=1 Tax=Byssothecium circinans TaxID=147558 RepID=A0A6A5TIG5_9PLEO|nr:hypothetical protein CC80DRAFT_482446 [Byssothecium circinans]